MPTESEAPVKKVIKQADDDEKPEPLPIKQADDDDKPEPPRKRK